MTLFAALELGTLILLVCISFVSSFMTVALGIGGGTLMLAVMATVLPPTLSIPLDGVIQLGSNAGRTLVLRSAVQRETVGGFFVGALVGVTLGGLIVVELSAAVIQMIVGLFILWTLGFKPPRFLLRAPWLIGATSSVLTMLVGGTGPFVAAFARARHPEKLNFVATSAALMTIQHGLKTAVFVALGVSFLPWIGFLILMVAAGFLGTWIGRRVLLRVPENAFRRVLAVILAVMALRLIWEGLSGFLT